MTAAEPAVGPTAPDEVAAPPVALYVHVPFCVSVCPYCDFVVYGGAAARGPRSQVEVFMTAVATELELRADRLDARFGQPDTPGAERPPLRSVYLGGGTPSLLPPVFVSRLLNRVHARFGLAPDAEVTLEVNPGPDERGDLVGMVRAGVTRVSIGAQRLDRDELRALGRRHDPEDVAATVAASRRAGVASIGVDLLYDIPGDTPGAWAATLDRALALEPDHLSLYALTLDDPDGDDHLPVRPGARRWRREARVRQDEDRAADAYRHATERLRAAGYRGYEISNWARPGHESRHNLVYWERRPHEALGPGAHAFDGVTRRWTAARLDGYLAALAPRDGGRAALPPGGEDAVGADDAEAERLVLALRLDRGVPAAAASRSPLSAVAPWALRHELLALTSDERLVLTTRGRMLSNEVFARLI